MECGAALLLTILLAAAGTEEAGQAVKSVYEEGRYQTEHPQPWPSSRTEAPRPPPRERASRRRQDLAAPQPTGAVLNALLWTAAIVVAVLLVLALLPLVRRRFADRSPAPAAPTDATGPPALDLPRSDAERLAAAGRYDEAVHVLLLQTLQALAEHQQIPASLTSREILRRLQLEADPRAALARLVRTVEVSLFGGATVDRATYGTCLLAFEGLRASLAGRGA